MTKANGAKSTESMEQRWARLKERGGITPVVDAWLRRRTEGFQRATGGKGKPMVYGAMKKEGKGK